MNEVIGAGTPDQTASRHGTPSSGGNSGMIGLRMRNEMPITNCTPTIVPSVLGQGLRLAEWRRAQLFVAFGRMAAQFG